MTVIIAIVGGIVGGMFGGFLAKLTFLWWESHQLRRIMPASHSTYTWVSKPIESDWFRTRDA